VKKAIQAFLQRLLGFDRYLFLFSRFKIMTLRWDKREGDFLHFLRLLKPEDTVLDIGANIGIMTARLAKRCPKGKIFAFEPIPENFRALQRIVHFYRADHVSLHPLALGNENRQLEMAMPVLEGVRMQGLSHVIHDDIEGYDSKTNRYSVPQHKLDDLEFLQNEKIHAIKMDVENYEYFVLEGGKQLISRHMPIIYTELWDNENRVRCFELLRGMGYQVWVLEAGKLSPFEPGKHPHQNFFFLHPEA
jgi:FkbM family methyltransferase